MLKNHKFHLFLFGFLFMSTNSKGQYITSDPGYESQWAGNTKDGLIYSEFYCPPGSYVNYINIGQRNGGKIGALQFRCTDGTISILYGSQGTTESWQSDNGFSKLYVCADGYANIWGMASFSGDGNVFKGIGICTGMSQQTLLNCNLESTGHYRLITGIMVYYDPNGLISVILSQCSTVECPRNYYMRIAPSRDCIPCGYCADYYNRVGCGKISEGACIPCPSCSKGEFRLDCKYNDIGTCVTCAACDDGYFINPANNCDGTEITYYFYGRRGILTNPLRRCDLCLSCNAGFYNDGCISTGTYPGACTTCGCPEGKYNLKNCGGRSPGTCDACPDCLTAQYRSGCAGTNSGVCRTCQPQNCTQGQYLSRCSGTSAGSCTQCATDCAIGNYKSGCAGMDAGSCSTCYSCPSGQYMSGCGGTSNGSCIGCLPGKYSDRGVTVCLSCAVLLPLNSQFTSLCEWKCNNSYYKNYTTNLCILCTTTGDCPAGKFRPVCQNAIADSSCIGICMNKPQDNKSYYIKNCEWGCNIGFYKTSFEQCADCPGNCPIGFFPNTFCFANPNTFGQIVSCNPCTSILKAVFTGMGSPLVSDSCPFRCDSDYYASSRSCIKFTNLICNPGNYSIPGNSITDNTCGECNPKIVLRNYTYDTNLCTLKCSVGYGLSIPSVCTLCIPGKYQSVPGLIACADCPLNTYQPNYEAIGCITVPINGSNNALKTDFTCNGGYFRKENTFISGPSCSLCSNYNPTALAQSKNIVWNNCQLQSLSCNTGYYRNWTRQGCIECPSEIPKNSTPSILIGAICLICNTSSAEYDRNTFCPFQCNNGYYTAPSLNYSCTRCSTRTCISGMYSQPCFSGGTSDVCTNCSYQLQLFQIWTSIPCQWQCDKGYYLGSDISCKACPIGKYKTFLGNQSCINCAPGSYSSNVFECLVCERGSYSNSSSSSACLSCAIGVYSPEQNSTVCSKCTGLGTYPSSVSQNLGSSACVLCPGVMPLSVDGVLCSLPKGPCPKGFYLPFLSQMNGTCELCPIGTYCNTSTPSICPTTRPFSVQPTISINNCTDINPDIATDLWRQSCT